MNGPQTRKNAGLLGALAAIVLRLARPLLRLNLLQYKRDVESAIFPSDDSVNVVQGDRSDRLLFIGDVAVAGYGVLRHGMTSPAYAARSVARLRQRGCTWRTIQSPDLTVARLVKMNVLRGAPVDCVVLMTGVPDVLLATGVSDWTAGLRRIVTILRENSDLPCVIVFTAIPPMGDFRPIPPVARRLLTLQIDRLNEATQALAAGIRDSTYIDFPRLRTGELFFEEEFSWKALHEMWGKALAPGIAAALDAADWSSGV